MVFRLGPPNNYKATVQFTELLEYSGPISMATDFE